MTELATEAQRAMIINKRRTTAWLEKLLKNMSEEELIKLVCKEQFIDNWAAMTKEKASMVIDYLMRKQGRASRFAASKNRSSRYYQGQTLIGGKPSSEN